jgi:hypothetical protein
MATFEDQKTAAKAALDELKTAVAAKIGEAEARAADAEKKLQDAAASAVPLDELNAWFEQHLADIKGVVPT